MGLDFYSLNFFRHEWLKTVLTIIGVALGIAVYFAIRTVNQVALEGFEHSASMLHARTSIEILSIQEQIPLSLLNKLRTLPEIKAAMPKASTVVRLEPDEPVTLIGIDMLQFEEKASNGMQIDVLELLRDPHAVLASATLFDSLGMDRHVSVRMAGQSKNLTVIGRMADELFVGKKVLLTDIGHFQQNTEQPQALDAIELQLADTAAYEAVEQKITSLVSGAAQIQTAASKNLSMQRTTQAFRMNVNFLACISLFISGLLIYNVLSFLTLKRRSDFGILRTLGVTPREIMYLVLSESVFIGVLGGCLGILFGWGLAHSLVEEYVGTVRALYVDVGTLGARWSWLLCLEALAASVCTAVLGGVLPARESGRSAAITVIAAQTYEQVFQKRTPVLALIGALLIGIALSSSISNILALHVLLGFLPPMLFVSGFVLCIPYFSLQVLRLLQWFFSQFHALEMYLAASHLRSTLRRNSVSAAAVAVALGMLLSVTVMIASFRSTVVRWIENVTPADVFIAASAQRLGGSKTLDDSFLPYVQAGELVKDVDWIRHRRLYYEGFPIDVRGVRFDILHKYRRLSLVAGQLPNDFRSHVLVSEAFAKKYDSTLGETLQIEGMPVPSNLKIVGIFEDFTTEHGAVALSIEMFTELFGGGSPHGISVYLKDPADSSVFINTLRSDFSGFEYQVRDRDELRSYVTTVFDETFRITYALQSISIVIAYLVVINSMLMLLMERHAEFRILRMLGGSKVQIRRLVLAETFLLAKLSILFALLIGTFLALFLVYVVNTHFFAWSIVLEIPWKTIALIVVAALVCTVTAGFIPSEILLKSTVGRDR